MFCNNKRICFVLAKNRSRFRRSIIFEDWNWDRLVVLLNNI